MSTILAAVAPGAAAGPVLEAAIMLGERLKLDPVAVHVAEGDPAPTRLLATSRGVPLRLLTGIPADAIVAAAEAEHADMVVVGARRLPAGRRPAGATALAVAAGTSRVVVVVPPRWHLRHPLAPKLLALPLQVADEEPTVAAGRALSRLAGAGIELLAVHVFDDTTAPRFWDRPGHDADAWKQEFLARSSPTAAPELELRAGLPAEAILDVARERGADLIALSWGRDPDMRRAPVVREVIARSTVPVVLLPGPGRASPD